jgi:hypothetical protein
LTPLWKRILTPGLNGFSAHGMRHFSEATRNTVSAVIKADLKSIGKVAPGHNKLLTEQWDFQMKQSTLAQPFPEQLLGTLLPHEKRTSIIGSCF